MSFLEYAPAPESRAILNLRDDYGLFIDGEFVDGTGEPFATISPAEARPTSQRSRRRATLMSTSPWLRPAARTSRRGRR